MGDGIQKKYALIVNGDTEVRHLANVGRAIAALRAEDPSYEIAVASPNAPTAGTAATSPPDAAGIHRLVDGLAGKMDDDDLLVVYATGHGDKGWRGEGCVALPDGCHSLEALKQELARVRYGERIVVMDQCYGGRGLSLFADAKTTVVTQGSANETVCCGLFSPHFWSPTVPDANGDGVVTVRERYEYAKHTGKTPTLTQYYAPMREISLAGVGRRTPAFPAAVTPVTSIAQFDRELGRLSETEVALVMFSAGSCKPCKDQKAAFEETARRLGGRLFVIMAEEVNGAENEFPARLGIKTFPTYALMRRDARGGFKIVRIANPSDLNAGLVEIAIRDEGELVAHYLQRMDSQDRNVRLDALLRLGKLSSLPGAAFSRLKALLHDPDDEVANAAIWALGNLGPAAAAAVPDLIGIIRGNRARSEKRAAFLVLALIDPKSAPHVVPLLAECFARGAIDRYALGDFFGNLEYAKKDDPAFLGVINTTITQSLLPMTRRLDNEGLRLAAFSCLESIRDYFRLANNADSSIDAVMIDAALHDPSAKVRLRAASGLTGNVAHLPVFYDLTKDKDDEVSRFAEDKFKYLKDEAKPDELANIAISAASDPTVERRKLSIELLRALIKKRSSLSPATYKRCLSAFIPLLTDSNLSVSSYAFMFAQFIEDSSTVPIFSSEALLSAVRHAVEKEDRYGKSRALDFLNALFKRSPDMMDKAMPVVALGLRDSDKRVRENFLRFFLDKIFPRRPELVDEIKVELQPLAEDDPYSSAGFDASELLPHTRQRWRLDAGPWVWLGVGNSPESIAGGQIRFEYTRRSQWGIEARALAANHDSALLLGGTIGGIWHPLVRTQATSWDPYLALPAIGAAHSFKDDQQTSLLVSPGGIGLSWRPISPFTVSAEARASWMAKHGFGAEGAITLGGSF